MVAGMPESVHRTRKTNFRNFLVYGIDAPVYFSFIDPKGFSQVFVFNTFELFIRLRSLCIPMYYFFFFPFFVAASGFNVLLFQVNVVSQLPRIYQLPLQGCFFHFF